MADPTPFAIRTRGLNLWYGTFQALFDIDLAIKSGKITSMIGPSGCGKSTLLRSISGRPSPRWGRSPWARR